MAMLHPDDKAFANQEILSQASISGLFNQHLGLVPTNITSPESQGQFHKVYFVSLPEADGHQWSGKDVVLRVARYQALYLSPWPNPDRLRRQENDHQDQDRERN